MSDTIDDFRFMSNVRAAKRKLFGVPCPQCNVKQPKRQPTILLPGQRCRVDGYRDPREETDEQFQAACDLASQEQSPCT